MEANYKVQLDIFEGPLDLLLYLIKKDEVDIYDISIERITKQYFEYLNTFKALNVELAGEFIVMAANLMYIKSRNLLPKSQQPPEEDGEEEDPRWQLIRQLIEYKKFKDAAQFLGKSAEKQALYFSAMPEPVAQNTTTALADIGVFELTQAFQKILQRYKEEHDFGEIEADRFTVAEKIDFLLNSFPLNKSQKFHALFTHANSRTEVIVTFLALLELIKLNQIRAQQNEALGEIEFFRVE